MHDVTVLMVTFSRSSLFSGAISSLIDAAECRAIVVVDNNSLDALEYQTLVSLFGDCKCQAMITMDGKRYDYAKWVIGSTELFHIASGENIGGAGGFDVGLRFASHQELSNYVYFTDDDVVFPEDPFPALVEAIEIEKVPFASSLIFNANMGAFELNQHKASFDRRSLREAAVTTTNLDLPLIPIQANGFVGVLCRLDQCIEIGGVYPHYFILYDDVDLTYRLSKKFGVGLLVAKSRITHLYQPQDEYPSWKMALFLRNRIIFARRCFDRRVRFIVLFVSIIAALRSRGWTPSLKYRLIRMMILSCLGFDMKFDIGAFKQTSVLSLTHPTGSL